jgi:hypothetical protein
MQTPAFLWFELHGASRRLRAIFAESPVTAKRRNLNTPSRVVTGRRASGKSIPRISEELSTYDGSHNS